MVLNSPIIKHIGANLRAPLYLLLIGLDGLLCGTAFFEFVLIKFRAQNTHRILLIHQLRAGLLILDNIVYLLARLFILEVVAKSRSGLDLIHILTSRTTRTECFPLDIGRIYHHLDSIIYGRRNGHRSECCLSFIIGIEWRKTHQTMHSVLTLEIAVGELSLHLHCAGFNAHLVALLEVEHLNLIAVSLAPTSVHTEQHRSPIEGLCTSGTCIDIDNCAHLILLTGEHIAQFELLDEFDCSCVGSLCLLLACKPLAHKLRHQYHLIDTFFYLIKTLYPTLHTCDLTQLLLRLLGHIPKVGSESLLLLVLKVYSSLVDVKGTSPAYPDALQAL